MNKKIISLTIVLVTVIIGTTFLFVFKLKADRQAKRLYSQGMEYYNNFDYSNAYYNFNQIKRYTNFYPLALLKRFQCANNLQDKKTAQIILKELIRTVKDDNIRPFILYNDAILNQELSVDKKGTSQRKFKYIFENYPSNDYSYASQYKYAKLVENENKQLAKKAYLEYLSYAPNGKYSLETLKSLAQLNVIFNKDDYQIIADTYFKNSNYQQALLNYENTSFEKNWVQIAKCYKSLKSSKNEADTLKQGLALKYSSVEEKELSYALDRMIALYGGDKIQILQEIYSTHQNAYFLPTLEYKLAEALNTIRSIKFYEDIVINHSDSMWAGNSLWEMLWYNYQENRFQNCEKIYKAYFEKFINTEDAPRISYWYAKALLNQHKNMAAKEAFHKVINDYPLSFYAFLSARQLKISKEKRLITKKQIVKYDINSINKDIFKNPTLLMLANNNDWQTIEDLKIEDEYIKSWLLNKKEQYPASIRLAKKEYLENNKDKKSFSDWQIKLLYPIVYGDLINEVAKEHNRSPYLFLSLVREESHFSNVATSSVGAIGLSQIMPMTANFIEKRNVSKEELLDHKTNIEIGLDYYNYLTDFFNGNEFLAIMSYNAGPGNINKWIKSNINQTNEIDVFIENVPFLETKTYIKKILSSYWIYVNFYSNKYI